MDDDWGLQAVVKGCCTTTTTITTATPSFAMGFHSFSTFQPPPPPQTQEDNKMLCFQNLYEPRNEMEYLHDLWKPFVTKAKLPPPPPPSSLPPPPPPPVSSPLSVLSGLQDLSSQQIQQQVQQKQHHVQPQPQPQQQLYQPKQKTTTHKRRKNQMKRVCQVAAEGLSSDMWSWRKYGQKPIKGSPYPRGYYRCSTSKGCLARKQVERNRSDPNMFIVTYTAEHNHPVPTHRNSLAGISRQKPETPPTAETVDPNKPILSPAAANLSPVPANLDGGRGEKEEDEDDFSISDLPLDDDFFVGLDDELTGPGLVPAQGDSFSDYSPATNMFPWVSNSATTTTTAGGGG